MPIKITNANIKSTIANNNSIIARICSLKFLFRKMMRIYVWFLVLPNIICFGYRFSDYESHKNSSSHVKKRHVNDTSVPTKVL